VHKHTLQRKDYELTKATRAATTLPLCSRRAVSATCLLTSISEMTSSTSSFESFIKASFSASALSSGFASCIPARILPTFVTSISFSSA